MRIVKNRCIRMGIVENRRMAESHCQNSLDPDAHKTYVGIQKRNTVGTITIHQCKN